jgi:hypothetical protein
METNVGRLVCILVAALITFSAGSYAFSTPFWVEGGIPTGFLILCEMGLSLGLGLMIHRLLFKRQR